MQNTYLLPIPYKESYLKNVYYSFVVLTYYFKSLLLNVVAMAMPFLLMLLQTETLTTEASCLL